MLYPAKMPKDLNLQLSRLDTLRASYRGHQAAETDYWTPTYVQTEVDVGLFRANNAYIYQFHNSWQSYAWSVANVKSRSNAVFDLLHETGDYGAEVHFVDGKAVGRDLLDSAAELQFILDSVRPARRLRIL